MQQFIQSLEPRRFFDAGLLDAQFNPRAGGAAVTDFPNAREQGRVALPMADGRVVIVGGYQTEVLSFGWGGYVLLRHRADGSYDPTFGAGGAVKTEAPVGLAVHVNDAAIQSDGSIIVLGSGKRDTRTGRAITGVVLARFTPSGQFDPSFGNGGILESDLLDVTDERSRGIALLPNGKILVGGVVFSRKNDAAQLGVIRFNVDGGIDDTFGDGGRSLTPPQPRRHATTALLLDAGGSAVVVGQTEQTMDMARFAPDGALVGDFGAAGVARFDDASAEAQAATLTLDGGIVTVGENLDDETFRVAKFDARGRRVLAFGNDGIPDGKIDIAFDGAAGAHGVTLQSDGKLVVAGTRERTFPNDSAFALARLNADGSLDSTWGASGRSEAHMDELTYDSAANVAIAADGTIYAVGVSQPLEAGADFLSTRVAVARFWQTEAPSAQLRPRTISSAGATGQTFSVVYRDDGIVDPTRFDNADLTVIGPTGKSFRALFVSSTAQLGGAVRIANYNFAAPGGSFGAEDNGVYTIRLRSNQVGDIDGNLMVGRTLGTLRVAIASAAVTQSPFGARAIRATGGGDDVTEKELLTQEG